MVWAEDAVRSLVDGLSRTSVSICFLCFLSICFYNEFYKRMYCDGLITNYN